MHGLWDVKFFYTVFAQKSHIANLFPFQTFQIHSLTARSVPRHFREGLKKGMPCFADRNIKIPNQGTPIINNNNHLHDPQKKSASPATSKVIPNGVSVSEGYRTHLHIIYDSERKDLEPYPDRHVIRTSSPEHTGIPAKPVKVVPRVKDEDYTSDDSLLASGACAKGNASNNRRQPPHIRRRLSKKSELN